MSSRHVRSNSEYISNTGNPTTCNPQALNNAPSTPMKGQGSKMAQMEDNLLNDIMRSMEKKPWQRPAVLGSPSKETMQQTIQNKLTGVVEHNQDYFDHLAGKCVCARCTCGKHKCNQRSGLITDGKRAPKTNYQENYDEKQAKGMQTRGECPMDNITIKKDLKFDGNTTHKDHYTPKQALPIGFSGKKPDNIKPSGVPNDFSTSYRDGYIPRSIVPVLPIVPNPTMNVVRGSPFIGKTENQISYSPDRYQRASPAEKADISKHSKGVNMGFDQSKLPGFYESTYQLYHSPVRGSLDKNKQILDSMKKVAHPPYKSTEFNFIPKSTQRDHFRPNSLVCPIVLERTRGMSTYQSPSQDDRLNMSVNF